MSASATTISTHVLDTALGAPAAGIVVTLYHEGVEVGRGETNADGRVSSLGASLAAGNYRLSFDVSPYFAATKRVSFYATISVEFMVSGNPQHYHVPLLLSPYGYSTYRGS